MYSHVNNRSGIKTFIALRVGIFLNLKDSGLIYILAGNCVIASFVGKCEFLEIRFRLMSVWLWV